MPLPGERDPKTGMSESLRLAELLCARLCHDLSGILGALIGILEIAREEQPEGETLALAEDTANELIQRLKLLRAAWGQDSETWTSLGCAASRNACRAAAGCGWTWPDCSPDDHSRRRRPASS